MKQIILNILAIAFSLTLVSCSDFLSEQSKTEIGRETYLENASEAENVLLGVYSGTNGDPMYGWCLSILFNLGTDMEQVEGSTNENFRIIPTNSFPTTQSEIQQSWATLYNAIYNANNFIETLSVKMESYSEEDKELATIYMAEARALRAWYYFELVRRWNRVVLMDSTKKSNEDPSTYTQSEPQTVYEFIETDLKYAIEILPYAKDDKYRASNEYRISKGAALGLLAKVYASWAGYPIKDESKWEMAALTAGKLIESGKHDLLANFEQLWINTCNGIWDPTESLLEVSFYSPTTTGAASDPVGRIGKWNGVKTSAVAGVRGSCAGNVKVVHPFVVEWRTHVGDLREAISVANYRYNDEDSVPDLWVKGSSDSNETALANDADPSMKQKEKQSYTPGKWDVEKYVSDANYLINNDKSNVNWYFLRYADVLLLYAEALNEWKGAPTSEAYAAVNKVRRRAYGNPSNTSVCDAPESMNQEEFREFIRKERAYELAFEGHRRMDLVRWGIYYETIQKTNMDLASWWSNDAAYFNYAVQRYTVKGKHELLPIPQRDMDLCQQFEQNPNW